MLVLLVAAVYSAPTYEDGDFVPENDIVPEETVPETSLAEWGKRTPKGKSARTGAHIGRRFHSCPPGRSCEFKVKLRIANSGGMLQGARNEHKKSSTKGNYVVRLTNIKSNGSFSILRMRVVNVCRMQMNTKSQLHKKSRHFSNKALRKYSARMRKSDVFLRQQHNGHVTHIGYSKSKESSSVKKMKRMIAMAFSSVVGKHKKKLPAAAHKFHPSQSSEKEASTPWPRRSPPSPPCPAAGNTSARKRSRTPLHWHTHTP